MQNINCGEGDPEFVPNDVVYENEGALYRFMDTNGKQWSVIYGGKDLPPFKETTFCPSELEDEMIERWVAQTS